MGTGPLRERLGPSPDLRTRVPDQDTKVISTPASGRYREDVVLRRFDSAVPGQSDSLYHGRWQRNRIVVGLFVPMLVVVRQSQSASINIVVGSLSGGSHGDAAQICDASAGTLVFGAVGGVRAADVAHPQAGKNATAA